MAYYVGDIPAEDLVLEPAENHRWPDLELFDEAFTEFRNPAGILVPADFEAAIIDGEIVVVWPTVSPFDTAGIHALTITVGSSTGPQVERIAPIYLVAQENDGWHTVDSARDVWVDAPSDDARMFQLLELAKQQVLAYAPDLVGNGIPMNYREAQIMQCRNIWNAGKVDPQSGGLGEETFVIRPFPLDWMIKQILRPKSAVPVVG